METVALKPPAQLLLRQLEHLLALQAYVLEVALDVLFRRLLQLGARKLLRLACRARATVRVAVRRAAFRGEAIALDRSAVEDTFVLRW